MAMIECRSLMAGYNNHAVSEKISFRIEPGEYWCIVGPNGSGKSTLMKTIAGLLPPVSGEMMLGDGLKKNELGYLPQSSTGRKHFPATVKELVRSGFLNRMGMMPFYTPAQKKQADENMQLLGIEALKNQPFSRLSGGQQQRVLLARAICASGRMLLLDEPVAGLDPAATKEMYDAIRRLNREQGMTILMISHDLQAALNDATHVLHVSRNGCFAGTRQDYLSSAAAKGFLTVGGAGNA